ncbi:MAG TPA: lysylphosphatidylglycerol synthase domain-containing protein, partial [Chloroflexota bacterium]|nr:lysylphosphatidylglycerol synthase domain-containing protein [Chloroflexota bacterium]
PLRTGEAIQVGFLTLRGGAVAPAAATLAGIKVMDACVLLLLAGSIFGASVVATPTVWALGAAAVLCTVFGIAVVGGGDQLRLVVMRLPLANRIGVAHLQDVARALRSQRVLLLVGITSSISFCAGLLANVVVLSAVGIQPTFDLAARVLVAGYAVGVLPALPARIGTFEAGVALALTSAGVAPGSAVSAAVTLHVMQLAVLALLVVVSLVVPRWSK